MNYSLSTLDAALQAASLPAPLKAAALAIEDRVTVAVIYLGADGAGRVSYPLLAAAYDDLCRYGRLRLDEAA
jgi:hypothetical protein